MCIGLFFNFWGETPKNYYYYIYIFFGGENVLHIPPMNVRCTTVGWGQAKIGYL